MAASKELCPVCENPFCVMCDQHFPCSCDEISDSGQVFFTSTEKSSKKRKKSKQRKKRLRSTKNNDTPHKPQHSLSPSDATKKSFCGICGLHFPCSCVEISDSGQVFFTSTEKSSKKRKNLLRSTRNNDTLHKPQRSLSASDATKKVIFPGRQLNLPELTSNEFLSVQIETLRLTGQTTVNLVEKLLAMVTNLTAEVTQLRNDNAVLQIQLCELEDLLFTKSCHIEAAFGTSSSQPGVMSHKDALANNQHQQVRNVNISKSSKNLFSTNQKSKTVA